MKFPVVIRQLLPSQSQSRFKDAPWYEILFWQTWFRFRCPPPTWRYPKAHKHLFDIDQRPFVNSESRQRYIGDEDDLYQSIIAFKTGWALGPRSVFSRSTIHLELQLVGLGVSKNAQTEFADMFDQVIAHQWLTRIYRTKHTILGQMGLLPAENGFSEIVFTDRSTAKKIAENKTYTINTIDINGHLAYECNPFANYLDYFVPFGPHDVLQFGFAIEANGATGNTATAAVLQDAKTRVHAIMNSLAIQSTVPHSPLPFKSQPQAQ